MPKNQVLLEVAAIDLESGEQFATLVGWAGGP